MNDYIVVVAGLPRSGSSMLMRMLEAGGVALLIDGIRKPDIDNPKGYYEFERVKKLPDGDIKWVSEAKGKAVKVLGELITYLPGEFEYKVLYIERNIEEVIKSQDKMLWKKGIKPDANREKVAEGLKFLASKIEIWLYEHPNFDVLTVQYNEILKDPVGGANRINRFLDERLNEEEMIKVVDQELYRNRSGT